MNKFMYSISVVWVALLMIVLFFWAFSLTSDLMWLSIIMYLSTLIFGNILLAILKKLKTY